MSSLNVDEDQRWVPTHVQVTVVRGRDLRAKGKHGTSDVYTIIQVGKEKYSTGVVEKTTSPEWKEECSFELLPGVLEEDGERSAYPPGSSDLILTVMHRALIGDVFLGQAVIPLDKAFQDNICMKNEWFKLNSKTGKKEKERGEVQVTVQFTRNNLTASMYDLAMKDKHRSTFGKLKDRMRGKKRSSDEDSSSAMGPSGQLTRVRTRLPSDGGGEEDYEDDEGGEGRRSKMRSFFLRGKLRKSSDTRSSTSLGSESSESSSRGGSLSPTAGISVVVSDLSNSPSNSSNLTGENSPDHTADTSPKLSPLKCEFIDEAGEITLAVPHPSVYVNGNHVYGAEPRSGRPVGSLGPLQKALPLSTSLQNLSLPRAEALPKGPAGDGRRWSFDKAGDEEKAAIAAALEQAGSALGEEEEEEKEGWRAQTAVSTVPAAESDSQGKKQRRNLFSHGRAESAGKGQSQFKDGSEQAPLPAEERNKGWFGSKDSHSKPSLVVSPKLEPSSDSSPTPHPPDHSWSPPAPSLDPAAWGSLLHHTNPFCHSQSTPPPMSPSNPFLSLLQCNPFYEEILADKTLKPALPPLSYLSSSDPQPPVATPSFRPSNPNPIPSKHPTTEDGINAHLKEDASIRARRRPLPPIPSTEKNPSVKTPSNPLTSSSAVEKDGWDSSFDAFAAGRMKSPEEPAIICRPQPTEGHRTTNDPLLGDKGEESLTTKTNQNMTVNYALHSPTLDAALRANTSSSLSEGNQSSTENLTRLAPIIYTIPSQESTAADVERSTTTNPAAYSLELVSGKPLDRPINTTEVATNAHGCLNSHHSHSFPNPCPSLELHRAGTPTSGPAVVGRLLKREEVHSSESPYPTSEMLPATSSEEAEGQELNTRGLGYPGISSHPSGLETLMESEDNSVMEPDYFSLGLGSIAQAQHDRHEEPQEELPSAVQKVILPCLQVEISSEDVLAQSPSLPPLYSTVGSMLSASSQPDRNNISLDGYRRENCNLIKNPINGCLEEVKNSFPIITDDVEAKVTPILEEEPFMSAPSIYIMTSSPIDSHASWESTPSSTSGTHDLTNGSTEPEKLYSDLLNTGHPTTGLRQVFDDTLLHIKVSDRSPSPIVLSLYESADSQQYQSCRSHQSSKCSGVSDEVLPWPRAETLTSANSKVCEDETFDECREPQATIVSMGTVPLDLEESEGSRTLDKGGIQKETLDVSHLERMREDEERPLTAESGLLIGNCSSDLETLSSALKDLCISPASGARKLGEGEEENQALGSNDQFSNAPPPQFAVRQRSLSAGTLTTSFEDLTASFGSDPGINMESPSVQQPPDLPPLTSSIPSLTAKSSTSLAPSSLPISPIAAVRSSPSMTPATAPLCTAKPVIGAPHAVLPQETQQAANQNSPHPVKPLTAGNPPEEKGRSVLASGLEKLKSTIHPGRSSQLSEPEPGRRKSLTEGAGSYYHLTHNELVSLLLQREAELERQKAEFARQGTLLVKREAELKKLKPQVRDLEDYIDTLLVRIMEQTPTLLQVRTKLK